MRNRIAASLTGFGMALGLGSAAIAGGFPSLDTELIASGLARPVFVTHIPGDTERIFVVEQRSGSTGRIRVMDRDGSNMTTFFTTSVQTASEQGLLGLAFDPDFENNGYFYVNYNIFSYPGVVTPTSYAGLTVIERYQVVPGSDPIVADQSSGTPILTFPQPQSNHNGGWIGFGPDGFLYIATGDGGSANDSGFGHTTTLGNSQDITGNLLGKMLRIDPSGDDFPNNTVRNYAIPANNPFVGIEGDDEIWHFGLRNPFRNSFDRETGELYIGDVGQNVIEEVSYQPANDPAAFPGQDGYQGGLNYGWRCKEGDNCFTTCGLACTDSSLVDPVFDYPHSGFGSFNCSITGGYVYRGCAIPELTNTYFFTDFCSGQIWVIDADEFTQGVTLPTSAVVNIAGDLNTIGGLSSLSSFGEDGLGELYIVSLNGFVFRVVPQGGTVDDNNDGLPDNCESVPAPECPGDVDNTLNVDSNDLNFILSEFGCTSGCLYDLTGDGNVNSEDLNEVLGNFGANCPPE